MMHAFPLMVKMAQGTFNYVLMWRGDGTIFIEAAIRCKCHTVDMAKEQKVRKIVHEVTLCYDSLKRIKYHDKKN